VATGVPSPGLATLVGKADSIGRAVDAITVALNKELVAGGGLVDLRKTLAGTNQLVATLNAIAVEQSRQLTATMSSLRHVTAAVDSAKIDSTLGNLRTASAHFAKLTQVLDSTSLEMRQIVTKVDSGNGTAAKLLNDPTVYNDLHRLLGEADSLVADLKKNPRKYVPPFFSLWH
jgi:phospholipid/cholesterol/gamma-HCH transport system substrate-binding protein